LRRRNLKLTTKKKVLKTLTSEYTIQYQVLIEVLATWEVKAISVDMLKKKDLTKNLINIKVNNRK